MKVKDSSLINLVQGTFVSKEGVYYYFDEFTISEINAGVTYTWEIAKEAIKVAEDFYGKNPSIGYITNRINDYSIKPTDWLKFYKNNYHVKSYAIVSNTKQSIFSASIERMFMRNTNVERFTDLYEAVNWTKQISLISNSKSNFK